MQRCPWHSRGMMPTSPADTAVAEIKAEMGRTGTSRHRLGAALGKSEPWVSRRLNGNTPLRLDELVQIGIVLGLDWTSFVAPDLIARGWHRR
jgi:transcriptional regulator with XRE-family HTH domain